MHNILDDLAAEVRKKRNSYGYSQKQLAERLHMSVRTIIDLENKRSNPKAETILLIAKELNISLDAIMFPEIKTNSMSKTVIDFFVGKSESDIQKYISLCQQADQFKSGK